MRRPTREQEPKRGENAVRKEKAALSLVAVVGIFTLASCEFSIQDLFFNTVDPFFEWLDSVIFPQERLTKEKIEAIMELIINEDKDALFEEFSEEKRSKYKSELKAEIEEMYKFLKGKIVSYGEPLECDYRTIKTLPGGIVTEYTAHPTVYYVETENGEQLVFRFWYTLVDEKNPENVGINSLSVHMQIKEEEYDGSYWWGERKIRIDGDLSD